MKDKELRELLRKSDVIRTLQEYKFRYSRAGPIREIMIPGNVCNSTIDDIRDDVERLKLHSVDHRNLKEALSLEKVHRRQGEIDCLHKIQALCDHLGVKLVHKETNSNPYEVIPNDSQDYNR